jgi:hypothetical protein
MCVRGELDAKCQTCRLTVGLGSKKCTCTSRCQVPIRVAPAFCVAFLGLCSVIHSPCILIYRWVIKDRVPLLKFTVILRGVESLSCLYPSSGLWNHRASSATSATSHYLDAVLYGINQPQI